MRKININGEELTITFNLATELSYEEITGKAFTTSEIMNEAGKIKARNAINCVIACVIANNPDAKTDSQYLLFNATKKEIETAIEAVMEEMMIWLDIPAIAEAHVKELQKEEEDERPKQ